MTIDVRPRSAGAGTRILAIDPGTTQSAWLLLRDGVPYVWGITANDELLENLRNQLASGCTVVIEEVRSYGMPVGREVFDTVRWTGRFQEAVAPRPVTFLGRKEIVVHLCGSPKAKDGNVRQALIDRFGGSAAIGRKAEPGPLHGIANDVWSALAIALTHDDQLREGAAA